MRFVSLLVTLLIMAWLILHQLGSGSGNATSTNTALQAEKKAKAVESQVLQSAQNQAQMLNHAEGPVQGESNP